MTFATYDFLRKTKDVVPFLLTLGKLFLARPAMAKVYQDAVLTANPDMKSSHVPFCRSRDSVRALRLLQTYRRSRRRPHRQTATRPKIVTFFSLLRLPVHPASGSAQTSLPNPQCLSDRVPARASARRWCAVLDETIVGNSRCAGQRSAPYQIFARGFLAIRPPKHRKRRCDPTQPCHRRWPRAGPPDAARIRVRTGCEPGPGWRTRDWPSQRSWCVKGTRTRDAGAGTGLAPSGPMAVPSASVCAARPRRDGAVPGRAGSRQVVPRGVREPASRRGAASVRRG